jgi:gluconokinase
MQTPCRFIIVMGVSGSGKTTIGRLLAARLGWDFYDADDFHSPENISKMAKGIPLTDEDRKPWLEALRRKIEWCQAQNHPGVLACSALKATYRDELIDHDEDIQIVYLRGSFDLIWKRMETRTNHYMKPDMLASQFAALEEPPDALVEDLEKTPEAICADILSKIHR